MLSHTDRDKVILWSDGGLRGKNPGALLYGSYQFGDYEPTTIEHRVRGSSNESEYLSLIEGINAVIQEYGNVQDIDLVIKTDSMLVRNQVCGRWRVNAENLRWLCYVTQILLGNFASWHIGWVSRNRVVEVLGH